MRRSTGSTFSGNTLTVSVSTASDEDNDEAVTHHSCSYYLSILKHVSIVTIVIASS